MYDLGVWPSLKFAIDPPGPVTNKSHSLQFPDGSAEMWAAVIIKNQRKLVTRLALVVGVGVMSGRFRD